ncbi:hypothetical protein Pstr01_19480 [Pseudomonas straminea]|nr:hypothetical protein Pstr01_19480 [Pseudomonas straminea]
MGHEAQLAIVIVEQHLDADGAFDQRQLAVEQRARQHTKIIMQALALREAHLRLLMLPGPDLAPEVSRVQGECADDQYRKQNQEAIKPHGTS